MGLDDVFARSRDLVIAADPSGRLIFANPAADTTAATWAEAFPAAARAEAEAIRARVVATGEAARFEWSRPGAVRSWFRAEVSPIAEGTLCISRDMSAAKRIEEMMVDTHGVAHIGTWEWDISAPTATWSAELYKIYGLTPETYTPSYEQYLTMVHPDDRQRVVDATNRVFHEHVPYSHDERIFRPDGTMRYLHTWAYPLLDEAGKLTHLIGVCQDITDRALAEEALQRANTELEHRVAERTRELEGFNSMVTHDLRAPLAVIQMSVDLLGRNARPEDDKYLDRIRRSVANMSTLMDDLLAFAKVGRDSLEPQRVDVTALCAELVADLRLASPARDVAVDIAPELTATADPALLKVALANLLGNAWKYTTKSPQARIEVGAGPRGLYVRDNGIGFDPADAGSLFTPFTRLRNARDLPGTGIGLATVHRIVERHGGTVAAESALAQGATFFLSLPGT